MTVALWLLIVLVCISSIYTVFTLKMALWLWQWRTQVAQRAWAAEERVREFKRTQSQPGKLIGQDACHWRFEAQGSTFYIRKPQRSAALEAFFKNLPDLEARTPILKDVEPLRVLDMVDGGVAFLDMMPPLPKAQLKSQVREANFRITVMFGFAGVGVIFTAIFSSLLLIVWTSG